MRRNIIPKPFEYRITDLWVTNRVCYVSYGFSREEAMLAFCKKHHKNPDTKISYLSGSDQYGSKYVTFVDSDFPIGRWNVRELYLIPSALSSNIIISNTPLPT